MVAVGATEMVPEVIIAIVTAAVITTVGATVVQAGVATVVIVVNGCNRSGEQQQNQ